MSPEKEPQSRFIIEKMSPDDVEPATEMRYRCWLDTYVNEEYDITPEWIEVCFAKQFTPEVIGVRKRRLADIDYHSGFVAKDASGNIVGSTTPFIDEEGNQDVGSLYVKDEWRGKGVAYELMQNAIDWFDKTQPIKLCVASYNERAKAFYQKWGFEVVPDSQYIHSDKIPTEIMIRKGDERYEI